MTNVTPDAPPGVNQTPAQERDEAWFDRLFADHARSVHRYFVRRAPWSDAEDLAADTFATAWRRRETIVDGTELAWLYRTAGFILANYRRREHSSPGEDVGFLADHGYGRPTGAGTGTGDPQVAVAERDRALRAFNGLTPRDQEVIRLVAWDGLDRHQLAEVLGVSVGGADAALSRARARLAANWQSLD